LLVLGDWGILFAICFQVAVKCPDFVAGNNSVKNFAPLFILSKMSEITGFLVIF
jgi:hypothetical protein